MSQHRKVQGRRYLCMLLLLCGVLRVRVATAAPLKVACIGEHTTHSDLYPANREQQPPGMQEYPRMLQDLMGSGYDVRNFGDCCASVIQGYPSSETHPYLRGSNYKNSVSFAPDIVVIGSWGRHDWGLSAMTALASFTIQKFQADYETLVKAYLALTPVPKIYCSLPIPILAGKDGPDNGYKTSPAADAIKVVAAKYNLPTIDLFSAFLGHPELYRAQPMKDAEGEHVNDAGMRQMAELVHDALLGTTTGGAAGQSSGGTAGQSSGGSGGGSPAAGANGINGGSPGAGADASSGGSSATAGMASVAGGADGVSAGTTGTAGTAVIAGGMTGTAAAGGSNDTSVSPDSGANGCTCSLASHVDRRTGWLGVLFVAAGSVLLVRRRACAG